MGRAMSCGHTCSVLNHRLSQCELWRGSSCPGYDADASDFFIGTWVPLQARSVGINQLH